MMTGLYDSGRSSPNDEFGRRLVCQLSENETGRIQGMHDPNAIWAMSVRELGVPIWPESLLGWEVVRNLKGTWL